MTQVPTTDTAAAPAARFSGLGRRLLSLVILVPLVVAWNITGGVVFTLGLTLVSAMMTVEWWRITWRTGWIIAAAGFPYILLSAFCLMQMRMISPEYAPDLGMHLIFAIIGLLAIVDSSAYFAGKSIGGKKLAPSISPNKTWAGLLGAMVSTAIAFVVLQSLLPDEAMRVAWPLALVAGAAFAVIAQLGDLLESWLKRLSGLKDSGGLIPGHGGLLDRADGYLTTVPLVWAWCLWQGWL
jgi:phosphatidate cytidylyltransferase